MELVKPGKVLSLRGAKVDMFKGSLRLVVPNTGSIEVAASVKLEPKVRLPVSLTGQLHCCVMCAEHSLPAATSMLTSFCSPGSLCIPIGPLNHQSINHVLRRYDFAMDVQVDNNVSLIEYELVPIIAN